jgi:hypothetical protein
MTEAEWLACADPFALYHFLRDESVTYKTRWQGWLTARRFPISERRLRLFACACCARVAHLLPAQEARELLAAAEAYADGLIGDAELEHAEQACDRATRLQGGSGRPWLGYEREAVTAVSLAYRAEAAGRLGALMAAQRAWSGAIVWRRHVESLGGVLRVKPGDFAPLEGVVRTCDRRFLAEEATAEAVRQAELLRDVAGNPFRGVSVDPAWLEWHDETLAHLAQAIYFERRYRDLPVLADALEDAGCSELELLDHCRASTRHCRGCWVLDLFTANQRSKDVLLAESKWHSESGEVP